MTVSQGLANVSLTLQTYLADTLYFLTDLAFPMVCYVLSVHIFHNKFHKINIDSRVISCTKITYIFILPDICYYLLFSKYLVKLNFRKDMKISLSLGKLYSQTEFTSSSLGCSCKTKFIKRNY